MGIASGYVCVLCFCILFLKIVTHSLHLKKADMAFKRLHKPISAVFCAVCVLHIALTLSVWRTRHILVWITGICIAAASIMLIVLCHTVRRKKLNLALHRIFSVAMLFGIVGHILVYFMDYGNYQTKIHNMELREVSVSDLKDGQYIGDYDAGYIYAKVQVAVKDGRIVEVSILEHDHERGSLAEKIADKVTDEQRIKVDTVSGATNSSLVIEKAIENALSGG